MTTWCILKPKTRVPATNLGKAMSRHIKLVTAISNPVSQVESPILRVFLGMMDVSSLKHFKETMIKLTELVEKRIGEEMCKYKGTVVHDG